MSQDEAGLELEIPEAEGQKNLLASSAYFQELFRETKNPLYAWASLFIHGLIRDRQTQAGLPVEKMNVPEGCVDYFTNAAHDLMILAYGRDFRKVFEERGAFPVPQGDMPKLVSQALGFSRHGGSAFHGMATANNAISLFQEFEGLRRSGLTAEKAREVLLQRESPNSLDDSALRKKITKGRRLLSRARAAQMAAG